MLPNVANPANMLTWSGAQEVTASGTIVHGNVRLRDGDILLTADEMRYDQTGVVTAIGHVTLTRQNDRVLADELVFRRTDRTFTAENLRLGQYPYYIQALSASGSLNEVDLSHVTLYYREPGMWQPSVTADRLVYVPGQRVRAETAYAGVGPTRPLPFFHFQEDLNEPEAQYIALGGGFRGSLGAILNVGLRLPVAPGIRVGGDIGVYTARGVMAGPAGRYISADDGATYDGYLRSGYINDHGNKLTDVLGRPIPSDRSYVEWQHQEHITDDLTLVGQLNYWKDSAVLRDFRPENFFNVQEPDTFLESVYTGKNYFISAFARFRPNSFEVVQQRLPEVRFDLMPTALGGGFYERAEASAVRLEETDPLGAAELRSDRLDAFYGLSRPFAPANWMDFTPVAGARITNYSNTLGAAEPGGATRVLGEVGFDAALRSSAVFDYQNPVWNIDGLRHLLTPMLSYRYIPGADRDQSKIPLIDRRQEFSTYLPTLDLGDVRNIDDLAPTNTLRLGINNTIQTRDPQYGSRDLLVFNVASDFRIHRAPGDPQLSDIQSEISLTPAHWLQFDIFERFLPQTFTQQELNTAMILNDGSDWSVRFANNYLRHQIQDYLVDGKWRLNERYQALARLQYDARKHRFNEQSYGIAQNLGNTWLLSYVVTLYSGRQRESRFGFGIKVDVISF